MALTPGTRLGPYEISVPIGVGGMGEVYRATDTNLKRAVAIKVLPASVADDVERLARFQREAEVLASLNHPHIAAIYGLERSGGTTALVMELVEGPTLADRIAQGPMPVDEALPIAKQIAEALETAHEQGIVHRDLKPTNIKLKVRGAPPAATDDGRLERRLSAADVADCTVKVLDFGLAKAMEPTGITSPHVSQSPTITSPVMMTGVGAILGTAAYMSPEQARGRPADRRSDIWAFGCVLFEMLSGQRAFGGETVTDVLASVVAREPEWSLLPATMPVGLRTVVQRCLRKNHQLRARDIGDVRTMLDEVWTSGTASEPPNASAGTARSFRAGALWAWVGAIAGLAASALLLRQGNADRPQTVRFVVLPPENSAFNGTPLHQAISPDGTKLAFTAYSAAGPSMLWIRPLDLVPARALPGTEGASTMFWSPDSTELGFFVDRALWKTKLVDGVPQRLADAPSVDGTGTWNGEGTIVYGPRADGRLYRVQSSGGTPTPLTSLDETSGEAYHLMPHFLPDGKRFLYFSRPGGDVRVGSVNGDAPQHLLQADCKALYAAGHLLFVRGRTLYRQPFSPMSGALTGEPLVVAENVRCNPINGGAGFSVSENGVLTHRSGDPGTQERLTWYTRAGTIDGTLGEASPVHNQRLAPNGRYLVTDESRFLGNPRPSDLWLIDLVRGSKERLTSDGARNQLPVWSPNGEWIGFSAMAAGGPPQLSRISAARPGEPEQLLATDTTKRPMDWSPDGRFLIYDDADLQSSSDIWVLPLGHSASKPFPYLRTKFTEGQGRFSPDGRWMAYTSDESGKRQVYLQSFPAPGPRFPVSVDGGTHAQWRRDGKEIIYMDLQRRLVSVDVELSSAPPTIGIPHVLFSTNAPRDLPLEANFYSVSPDAQRFLVAAMVEGLESPPITVVVNWAADPTH